MSNYQTLSTVANELKVEEPALLELLQRGWISSVEKNGSVFLSGKDAFRARFVLHLRRLLLTDAEISTVLQSQRPPYSLAEVPDLIGRPVSLH